MTRPDHYLVDHYRVKQRSGDYCDADGEDWPCATVRDLRVLERAQGLASHPSHPDQLMARALGVCWHSPTADRCPCESSGDDPHDHDAFCAGADCMACGGRHADCGDR